MPDKFGSSLYICIKMFCSDRYNMDANLGATNNMAHKIFQVKFINARSNVKSRSHYDAAHIHALTTYT